MRRYLLAILTAVALIGACAVVVQADVPDTASGEITACRNAEHSVRIIDTDTDACEYGETEVSWLAVGGTVYEDHAAGPQTISSETVVATVTVPAGRYQLTAKAWVDRTVSNESFVQCGFIDLPYNDNTRAAGSADDFATFIAVQTLEVATVTDIEYVCTTDAAIDVHRTSLVATSVSAIDAQ